MNTPIDPVLPRPYMMLGRCGKSSERRRFFMAANDGVPFLVWVEPQLPAAVKAQKMVVQTFTTALGETAILDVQSLTLQQLMDTTGSLPAVVAVQYALGLSENAVFFQKQNSLLTSTNRYGPSVLDISSQGTLGVRIDPTSARQAPALPAELLPPNETPTQSTDVFYIGALIGWMLRGSLAPAGTPLAGLPANLDGKLKGILSSATAANPKSRPSTEQLHAALGKWLQGAQAPVRKKSALGVIVGAIAITALALAAILYFRSNDGVALDIPKGTPIAASGGSVARTPTPQTKPRDIGTVDDVLINQIDDSKAPLVDIYVNVLRNNQPITNVSKANVRLFEDDQRITDFSWINVSELNAPAQVMLVLDTSGSMGPSREGLRDGALDVAIVAATDFLENLPSNSSVGLIRFASVVTVENTLTTDITKVKATVETMRAGGQTALYDGVGTALKALEGTPGRVMIVMLSDGDDTAASTRFTRESVIAKARETNIPIYIIGLTSPQFNGEVLKELAEASGAVLLEAPSKEQLTALYSVIFTQIQGQYRATYTQLKPLKPGEQVTIRLEVNDGFGVITEKTKQIIGR